MKITALYNNAAAINSQWEKAFYLKHELNNGVQYADEARQLTANLYKINWLDTMRHPDGPTLFPFNLYQIQTTVDHIEREILVEVNTLNINETDFPTIHTTEFHELCQGSVIFISAVCTD